jgi:hypothetical protein
MSFVKRSFVTEQKAYFWKTADRQTDSCHIPSMITFFRSDVPSRRRVDYNFYFFQIFFSVLRIFIG